MPAPVPLTACDAPRLDWSRATAPAASDFDDIYFSVDGGLAETEAVFLKGCGLPKRWQGRQCFVIGELGFGSGLNFLATWKLWTASKPPEGRLHFISVEKFPFDQDSLRQALEMWPELATYAERLMDLWPGRVKGYHRLELSPDVILTLIHDDIEPALEGLSAYVDAWFLDGFSPAKNPAMWTPDVMQQVGRLSAPGARVGTFTVAGAVRTALSDAGFEVQKKTGFGRKRNRLEAVYPGETKDTAPDIKPVIIGAGIGGASLAHAFVKRGIVPTLIDAEDGTGASGNPAAIVKPRLDLQDRPESRFFLSSYLYALRTYTAHGDVLSKGVFHAAKSEADTRRFEKLVHHAALPVSHMHGCDGPFGLSGLNFPQGLVIDPVATCRRFTDGANLIKSRVTSIVSDGDMSQVRDASGAVIATGTHIYVAMGAGIKQFDPASNFSLRYSRGQVTAAKTSLAETVTYGGYAIPLENYVLLGATHARVSDADPYAPRDADDLENITQFENMTGLSPEKLEGRSRASVRVTRANTLPLITELSDTLFAITALGSRGFVFAPLLAEDLVAQVCGEPGAFCQKTRAVFQAREKSNLKVRPV